MMRLVFIALLSSAFSVSGSAWAAAPAGDAAARQLDGGRRGPLTSVARNSIRGDVPTGVFGDNFGSLTLQFNITLKPGIPISYPILCSMTASVTDSAFGSYAETKTVEATRSGNMATCVVTIGYQWYLADSTHDINLTYSVSATGTSTAKLVLRQTSSTGYVFPMPENNGSWRQERNITL